MTINGVNWKEFQGVVQNGLTRADLSRADPNGSLGAIRSVINEVLEIYVESRYRDRFRIEAKFSNGAYEALLYHELTELCSWSVSAG